MRVTTALAVLALATPALAQDLSKGFQNPPHAALPQTWWHWMNGNITKEGITADLEAMKRIGLGGAQIFNVSESIPLGPIDYMSPQWLDLAQFAASEADRLGLELCMHNCAGWSSSGGPWVTPDHAMQMLVASDTTLKGPQHFSAALPAPETHLDYYRDIAILAFPTPVDSAYRIPDIKFKAGYESRYNQQPAPLAVPVGAVIKRDAILDITSKFADGRLTWDAPEGNWTILRIGYTPTGAKNAPSPDSGRGLECDKLSKDGLDAAWNGSMAKVIAKLGPLAGKALNNCLIDSYEVGGQNWTPKFRDEFKSRRGYDPLLLLPAMTGRVVDSGEVSERFLWDVRRTIADLFADNYYSYFAQLCHKAGLKASIEPYDGPFECLLSGRDADIPMGEFWVGADESPSCKLAASVAHTYGRTIVGAESFTAVPEVGRWLNHPYSLKAVGDLMYTVGINRYIIHRYAHQPWANVVPGMTMGQWGTHFERTTTWWNQGSAWVQYLARCQYMLQQGHTVADVCYFSGDAAPADAMHNPALKAKGFDYDACNTDVLMNRMSVRDGRLVLPDGMSYRLLVLPDTTFMTPRTLTRLRDLVNQGATILGSPPAKSPSLADLPEGDQQVTRLVSELWGEAEGEHAVGKGRVIRGRAVEQILAVPDCTFEHTQGRTAWIHRATENADIYFISNQLPRSQSFDVTFRISGKRPELWHADTGITEPAPLWSEHDGRTTVPLHLDPAGSVFVVFRSAATKTDHLASMTPPPGPPAPPKPKIAITKASYEATDGTGGADVTDKVAAMLASGRTTIPADNTAYGDPTYNHAKRLVVSFTLDGAPVTRSTPENTALELIPDTGADEPLAGFVALAANGAPELHAFRPGPYQFHSTKGRDSTITIKDLPAPVDIRGPWTIHFPPNWGAPESATFDKLISWSDHPDAGIKYFSGTAEYETTFDLPAALLGPGKLLTLDLGAVRQIAQVSLNGRDLGIWWKPPFAADISQFAKAGKNTLSVRITNLWSNRLIGDEQLPADVEWNGKPIKAWPDWLVKGTPRQSGRRTFTTWHHYTKDSPLVESGLLGPVLIRPGVKSALDSSPEPVGP